MNISKELDWTTIISTSENYPGTSRKIDFLSYPKMIDGGVVIFIAGTSSDHGIIRYSKGTKTIVADRNTVIPDHGNTKFQDMFLGSFHDVAPYQECFIGFSPLLGDSGIYLAAADNAPVMIATTSDNVPNVGGNFFGFNTCASNNDGKTVGFHGYSYEWDGIYTKQDGASIKAAADCNTLIPGNPDNKKLNYFSGVQIYQEADVLFFASRMREDKFAMTYESLTGHLRSGDDDGNNPLGLNKSFGERTFPTVAVRFNESFEERTLPPAAAPAIPGIYHYHAATNELSIIANHDTKVPGTSSHYLRGFSDPVIGGDHYATFRGSDTRGEIGIYLFDLRDRSLSLVVDSGTPLPHASGYFIYFDNLPSICGNDVLFQATASNSNYHGVYKKSLSTGQLSKVLDKTDKAMGYNLDLIKLGHETCESNNVAFFLVLKNGPFGHYTTYI